MSERSTSEPVRVVGAAIIRDGRVLACERSEPPALVGAWEFPGGKVEPDETDHDALVRECVEEIGIKIQVGARIGGDIPLRGGSGILRIWLATAEPGAEPVALEHLSLRWLSAGELDDVAWLPADRPIVDELRTLLGP